MEVMRRKDTEVHQVDYAVAVVITARVRREIVAGEDTEVNQIDLAVAVAVGTSDRDGRAGTGHNRSDRGIELKLATTAELLVVGRSLPVDVSRAYGLDTVTETEYIRWHSSRADIHHLSRKRRAITVPDRDQNVHSLKVTSRTYSSPGGTHAIARG